jgi:transaldolase/glucose-6-phosphate isomerase
MNRLMQLGACGQSPWLDYMRRSLIETGELRTLIERDGLKGVTSNPAIFEKAIGESDDYGEAIAAFQATGDHSVSEIYEHLAVADIQAAADLLRPVYEETKGYDGYVSLECSPYLANDTDATVGEALRLWEAVARPNLMVKVPATAAGLPAIRQLIGRGLNINVTLLFAVAVYEQVAEAYLGGLEDLARAQGDLSKIASVASFFVSRIDTAVDNQLDALGDEQVASGLRGKAAIAGAKLAYVRYQALFSGPRWEALAASGARAQRLLWASTSTKSSAYKDTMYAEALIGRDTVDTLPPSTMDAFRDHGDVRPDAIEHDVDAARAVLADLTQHGVSLPAITDTLLAEGVQQFADAFDKLLGAVAGRRRALLDGVAPRLEVRPGSPAMSAAFAQEQEAWRKTGRIRALWAGDPALWTGTDEERWLGWLTIAALELRELEPLHAFAAHVRQRAFTDVVLLGMGGSSLGPEMLAETFGRQAGWPRFHMLDSTDPAQINTIEQAIDLSHTLFIVSSKSGGTLEPNIFLDYFFDRAATACGAGQAGGHFVAVTDPGSPLDDRALKLGFAQVFYGAPTIGGRYSVLSKFGLAPAAAMGIDIKRLLEATRPMMRACGADVPPAENPAVQLGIALGVAATRFGRDKLTLVASPGVADLGAWLEQLIAESTGKLGRGLIPLTGEPLAAPEHYESDRIFAYLELEGSPDPAQRRAIEALEKAGHPVVWIRVKDVWSLGQEIFRWEMATAVAGAILGIDPFDQPDVEASKQASSALIKTYETTGNLPKTEPVFRENGVAVYSDPRNAEALGRHSTLSSYLRSHLGQVQAGDYVALLAYVERNRAHTETLTAIRAGIRDRTHAATCLGFGPRFQHSTGQIYKGGPNSGVFLQITCDDAFDIDVPGHAYSFGVVKAAQARGDFNVLGERRRRLMRVHLEDVETGLTQLAHAMEAAFA